MRENLVFFLIVFISIHRIDSILLFRHFNIDIQNKLAAIVETKIHYPKLDFFASRPYWKLNS
ncbi:unnamed protein product [Brassica oleracea var. botrytis]